MQKMCFVALSFMAFSIPACTSGANPSMAISVRAARQPKAPLRVVGFEQGSGVRGIEIVVKNFGTRPVDSFRLEAALRSPCGNAAGEPTWYSGSALNTVAIDPGSSSWASEQVSDTTILSHAGRLKAPYLQVQVGVVEVTFRDGGVWKNTYPDESGLFNPKLIKADWEECSRWPAATSAFDSITGDLTIVRDKSAGVLELKPSGYFLTCALKDGKAFCPTF